MWLVFPVFGIGVAHVVLGPLAIVFALMSRRVIVIAVVGLYFTLGVWPAVPLSITFARARVIDHFERFVEARNFAAETASCNQLVDHVETGGRRLSDKPRLSGDSEDRFDPDFRCRLPRSSRGHYTHASLVQLAALTPETKLLATLVERGVSVDDSAFMERSPLLLVLSDGNGLSTQGSMAQRPFAARMLTAAKILADAGASLTEAMIESAPPEMLPLLVRGDSG